jgi:hypothetical protein
MAEKAACMLRYDILIGEAALHDEKVAKGLQKVMRSANIPDRQKMKELTSKENIEAIMKRAEKMRGRNA